MVHADLSIHTKRTARAGFSLIEIMIAVAIMAVLAVLIVPNVLGRLKKAKVTSAETNLRAISAAITNFYADIGQYPTRLRDLVKKPTEEALAKKWADPYLQTAKGGEMRADPWGNQYQYKLTAGAQHPYELYSYGPNGKGAPKSEWISIWDL